MTDRARHQLTGEIVYASQIRSGKADPEGPWECVSCAVLMVPVACGTGKYNVAAHFRTIERHREDCDEHGRIVIAVPGDHRQIEETGSTAVDMPKGLYFRLTNSQGPEQGTNEEAIKSRKGVYVGHGGGARDGNHRPVANNVGTLARAYCDNPHNRNSTLHIQGCKCDSYATCIRQLPDGPLDEQFKGGILFAPIRFRNVEIDEYKTVLRLNRISARNEGFYRIKFVTNEWSPRTRTSFTKDLKKWLEAQKANYIEARKTSYINGWPKAVYIFFLMTERRSTVEFVVNRHQKFHFLELDKQQIKSL